MALMIFALIVFLDDKLGGKQVVDLDDKSTVGFAIYALVFDMILLFK